MEFNTGDSVGEGESRYILGPSILVSPWSSIYSSMKGNFKVVIKIYRHDRVKQQEVLNEVDIFSMIQHPAALTLLHYFEYDQSQVLVFPFCQYGDLYEYIVRRPSHHLPESIVCQLFAPIVDLLVQMRKAHIMHRDIKPENILLISETESVLADFGSAIVYEEGIKLREYPAESQTVPPEILRSQPYDESIDIWSLGCCIFFALFGYFPFDVLHYDVDDISDDHKWVAYIDPTIRISDDALQVLQACLCISPQERIQPSDLLMLNWFHKCRTNIVHETKRQTAYTTATYQGLVNQPEYPET